VLSVSINMSMNVIADGGIQAMKLRTRALLNKRRWRLP
jgi:hypothetical protein